MAGGDGRGALQPQHRPLEQQSIDRQFDAQAAVLARDVDTCAAKLKHDVMVRFPPCLTRTEQSYSDASASHSPRLHCFFTFCVRGGSYFSRCRVLIPPHTLHRITPQSAFNRAKLEVDEYYATILDDVRADHAARCDELQKEIDDLTELVESYVQVSNQGS